MNAGGKDICVFVVVRGVEASLPGSYPESLKAAIQVNIWPDHQRVDWHHYYGSIIASRSRIKKTK